MWRNILFSNNSILTVQFFLKTYVYYINIQEINELTDNQLLKPTFCYGRNVKKFDDLFFIYDPYFNTKL